MRRVWTFNVGAPRRKRKALGKGEKQLRKVTDPKLDTFERPPAYVAESHRIADSLFGWGPFGGEYIPKNEIYEKCIDAILEDDDETLSTLLPQVPDRNHFSPFAKMPPILSRRPPLISVCAFFSASKCFKMLTQLDGDFGKEDNDGRSLAHFLAAGGSLDLVRELETDVAEFFTTADHHGMFPVHYAAMFNRVELLQHMWLNGVNFSLPDHFGAMPLHTACMYGHVDVVKFFVEQGVELNSDTLVTIAGMTPMHFACTSGSAELVKYLISQKAEINSMGRCERTPICYAVRYGSLDIVKALVAAKARWKDKRRKVSPIVEAAERGFTDILNFFLKSGGDPNYLTSEGKTPLSVAVMNNHLEAAKLLLKYGAALHNEKQIVNPLLFAVKNHNVEMCKVLWSRPDFPELRKTLQNSQLIRAAVDSSDCKILEFLLKHDVKVGKRLTQKSENGDVQVAVRLIKRRKRDMLKLLVEHGFDPNWLASDAEVEAQLVEDPSKRMLEYLWSIADKITSLPFKMKILPATLRAGVASILDTALTHLEKVYPAEELEQGKQEMGRCLWDKYISIIDRGSWVHHGYLDRGGKEIVDVLFKHGLKTISEVRPTNECRYNTDEWASHVYNGLEYFAEVGGNFENTSIARLVRVLCTDFVDESRELLDFLFRHGGSIKEIGTPEAKLPWTPDSYLASVFRAKSVHDPVKVTKYLLDHGLPIKSAEETFNCLFGLLDSPGFFDPPRRVRPEEVAATLKLLLQSGVTTKRFDNIARHFKRYVPDGVSEQVRALFSVAQLHDRELLELFVQHAAPITMERVKEMLRPGMLALFERDMLDCVISMISKALPDGEASLSAEEQQCLKEAREGNVTARSRRTGMVSGPYPNELFGMVDRALMGYFPPFVGYPMGARPRPGQGYIKSREKTLDAGKTP